MQTAIARLPRRPESPHTHHNAGCAGRLGDSRFFSLPGAAVSGTISLTSVCWTRAARSGVIVPQFDAAYRKGATDGRSGSPQIGVNLASESDGPGK